MKDLLIKTAEDLKKGLINIDEARKTLLSAFLVSDIELGKCGLTLNHIDYGLYILKQNGEYIMEGERYDCNEKAIEIIKNI